MAGAGPGAVLREDGPVLQALHGPGAPRLLLRLDPAGTPSTPTPTPIPISSGTSHGYGGKGTGEVEEQRSRPPSTDPNRTDLV